MKSFQCLEIDEALAHAKAGGQALHLHRIIPNRATSPGCFVRAVDRGEDIAHLFDLDEVRLVATAKKLGVKVLFIDRAGTDRQHIDLCGAPLRKAKEMCEVPIEDVRRELAEMGIDTTAAKAKVLAAVRLAEAEGGAR